MIWYDMVNVGVYMTCSFKVSDIMLALWTCWVGLRWCHGSLFILGYFFLLSESYILHIYCYLWHANMLLGIASKRRAVFNMCSICRQGLEEQRNFWNIKKLLVESAGNAQVQVIWDSYRSHDGCDFTVHRGYDTICHPGLTRTPIHPLVGFVIHEQMWHLGKLLLAGC